MPSQSPTIDSTTEFAFEICSSKCDTAAEDLSGDQSFTGQIGDIAAGGTSIDGSEVIVQVGEGSGTCIDGCSSRRFLNQFLTDKDMSPVPSEDSDGNLLIFQTTIINVVIDMVATGESVNPEELLGEVATNKDTLNSDSLIIESVVLATQSPSSFPSSEPSATPSDSPSVKPSASPSETPSVKPSASPSDTPS